MLIVLGLLAAPASANQPLKLRLSTEIDGIRVRTLLPKFHTDRPHLGQTKRLDFERFVLELVAFVMKEILPSSKTEPPDGSLSPLMRDVTPSIRSRFGDHCLEVIARLGDALPSSSGAGLSSSEPGPLTSAVRGVGTVLFARHLWRAVRNEIRDTRSGVSLRPKVSTRKAVLAFTVRW